MLETHVYEVLPGELLLRRSGHRSPLQQCKVIRTRAIAYPPTDEGVKVMITLVVTGYESCVFAKWFADWSDKDNMRARDLQSGRVIDVAVPIEAYNYMLATGQPYGSPAITSMMTSGAQRPEAEYYSRDNPFSSPVAAVCIDGRWEEPNWQ